MAQLVDKLVTKDWVEWRVEPSDLEWEELSELIGKVTHDAPELMRIWVGVHELYDGDTEPVPALYVGIPTR